MKRTRETKTYRFKRGEILGLDTIYAYNGLWESDWWEQCPDSDSSEGRISGETIIITRDITITLTRTYVPE